MDGSDERSDALPVLSISNLTFGHEPSYKEVNRVNLKLHAGKSFGILGGNECGKTTLAHLILGNLIPESGEIKLFGEDITPRASPPPRWRAVVRVALYACAVLVLLFNFIQPSLLMQLTRSGAWSVPCLLLLLELTARAHARWWLGGNGDGSSSAGADLATLESGVAPAAMRARGIGYISSEHDAGQKLPADATIEAVISQHMPLPKGATEARRREVIAALNASGFQMMAESGTPVGSPAEYLANGLTVGELSGGQRHLIYMLSVLAARPKLLICDDCLCGLDIDRQSSMVELLQKLQLTFNVAILYMTVDLTSFTLMAHDAAFMKHGRFLETAPAHELVETPQRKDTQVYVQLSLENEERSHGKNLRRAYQTGESVFSL